MCGGVNSVILDCAHHILVGSEDGGGDDSQEQADHVKHHWGPQQAVQVDHVPAAADPGELVVLCVVLCAGRERGAAQSSAVRDYLDHQPLGRTFPYSKSQSLFIKSQILMLPLFDPLRQADIY